MTNTKTINRDKNRAECINRLHSYINEVVPKLIKELETGLKISVNNEFFKRDKEKINKILNSVEHSRAYISISDYSMYLSTDDNWQDSEYGCCYYKASPYLWDRQNNKGYEFTPLKTDYTEEKIKAIKKAIDIKTDEQNELGYEVSRLKRELGE